MRTRPYLSTRSKPPIKAPSPILERCKIGKGILHSRATAVRNAKTLDEFYTVEGRGWMKYCRHVKKCEQCGTFEMQKRLEQDKRFDKSLAKP